MTPERGHFRGRLESTNPPFQDDARPSGCKRDMLGNTHQITPMDAEEQKEYKPLEFEAIKTAGNGAITFEADGVVWYALTWVPLL
eukprot:gene15688-4723_t